MHTIKHPVHSILIEVNSNIGDLVMNIPILHFLHSTFPNASIDIVGDKRSVSLLNEFTFIRNIYIKEKTFQEKAKLLLTLIKIKYDLAIGLRSDAIPLLIRAKTKLYKYDRDSSLFDKTSETLYQYSILKKHFLINEKDIDTTIEFSLQTLSNVKQLIPNNVHQILFIAPSANDPKKIWPKKHFIELIQRLAPFYEHVVILGSPAEKELCKEIAEATSSHNLAGELSLLETAAIIQQGSLFIGNDSGLGHIAAAQKIPTLSIFAQADPIRYTPFRQYSIYREDKDISKITVEEVYQKLLNLHLLSKD